MEREPFLRRYRRFWGADPKRDVDEELAFHLAMRADEYRRAGMSNDEAEEATMRRFGDVKEVRAEVEDIAQKRHARRNRAWRMDALRQDLRFAVRTLVANPGYGIIVALTLGLGIGANAAVFSVAYGVLLRPLPYRDADDLVRVWSSNPKRNLDRFSVSPADFVDWAAQMRGFSAMAAFERQRDATLATRDEPQSVSITTVTPGIFPLLGAAPLLGRTLVADDVKPDAPAVAVMSHALWTTRFGGDRAVVGRDVTVDGQRYAVVGVMPPRFLIPGTNADIWTPLVVAGLPGLHSNRYLRVLGRLAPGVDAARAHAELDVLAARTAKAFPADAADWSTDILPVPEWIIGTTFRRAVITLLGVVAFVLLIACANAANLQLARAASRNRELAVRAALGASRGRITLQLLTESLLIALIAGVLGLALAYGGVVLLRMVGTTTVPRLEDVRLDAPVLLFTTAVALGSGVLFGLLPAIRAARTDVGEVLKEGGRGAGRTSIAAGVRGALVVAEIAMSLVLLIGAGLLMRSLAHLQAVDVGFDDRGLLVVPMNLPRSAFPTPQSTTAFFTTALDRAAALGGVESIAAVSSAPFAGGSPGVTFLPVGQQPPVGAQAPGADVRIITPGYLKTMRIHLLRGRDFSADDREGAPGVALISAATARRHWPNDDPIGKQIRVSDVVNGPPVTIVGVVADVRYQELETDGPRPMLYFSWHANPRSSMTLVARTRGDAAVTSLRTMIASLDRRLPVPVVTPMATFVATAMATRRFASTLFGIFAATALVLAAIGLYGVLSYLVRLRSHELGIRVALGAPRSKMLALVVGGALRLTVIGVAVGLVGSYVLTRSLGSLLFGVSPTDTETFVALSLLLAAIAVLASLVPALRATRADPMLALRGEG
jgi:predicted permease